MAGKSEPLIKDGKAAESTVLHQSSLASSIKATKVVWIVLCANLLWTVGTHRYGFAATVLCYIMNVSLQFAHIRGSGTPTVQIIYQQIITLFLLSWNSLVFALPFLALGLTAPTIMCFGIAWSTLTFLSIICRVAPEQPWPGAKLLLKIFWDLPFLLLSYIVDQLWLAGVAPLPFFFNGRDAELVSNITDNFCMGGRPLAKQVPELLKQNVHTVLNMTAEWPGPVAAYAECGIEQLQLATVDTIPPSYENLCRGVEFARERLKAKDGKGRVYIHCKGGRGRAFAMLISCLVAIEKMEARPAFKMVKEIRPVVELGIANYADLRRFVKENEVKKEDNAATS